MNRSMLNNNYYNSNESNKRTPMSLKKPSPNINTYNEYDRTLSNQNNTYNNYNRTLSSQKNNKESYDKTKGPYGVRFDEMEAHWKLGQKQYKDDLEYLMSLKKGRHGDMTQKEWEEYNRKLHYMNDVSFINYFIIEICIWRVRQN